MRVTFNATLDDLVDVQLQCLKRSKYSRRWRRQEILATGVGIGLLLFAVIPGTLLEKAIGFALGMLTGALISYLLYRTFMENRLRPFFRELIGENGTFDVQIELTEDGVHVTQLGTETVVSWKNIEAIQLRKDSVDLLIRPCSMVAVRKRGFRSTTDLEEFMAFAERCIDGAKETAVI